MNKRGSVVTLGHLYALRATLRYGNVEHAHEIIDRLITLWLEDEARRARPERKWRISLGETS